MNIMKTIFVISAMRSGTSEFCHSLAERLHITCAGDIFNFYSEKMNMSYDEWKR